MITKCVKYFKLGDIITKWIRYFKLGRILLQSGSGILETTNSDEYFYKVCQVLQTGTNIIANVCQVLPIGTNIITKWVRYFKLRGILLQSRSGITNCD